MTMKKHFLLLVMAFFSLAGWAEDLTDNEGVVVAVADIEYGQLALGGADLRVTLDGADIPNTYWDLEGFYETNDGTSPKIAVGDLKTLPVGAHRYAKIVFKGVYSGYAYGDFEVKAAVLKVLIKTNPYFTMAYKTTAAKPTLVAGDVVGKLRAAEEDITEADYLTIDVTKLNNYSWTGENVSAEGYPIIFPADAITLKDGLSADNYDLQIEARTMKITPATIETGGLFEFTTSYTGAAYTYSAAEQKPTFGITWNHDNNAETAAITLVEGTDYEWVYKAVTPTFEAVADGTILTADNTYYTSIYGEGEFVSVGTEVADGTNYFELRDGGTPVVAENTTDAATYNVFVNGLGNYGGELVPVAANDFIIKKAPLTVMPIAKEKTYNGEAFDAATAQFNVSGRVGADATKAITGLAATEVDVFSANVASYTVGVNTAAAKIGDVLMSKNYDITALTAEWEIKAKAMTITVADVEMVVGAASYPALNDAAIGKVTVSGAVDDADENAAKTAYVATLEYADDAEGEPLYYTAETRPYTSNELSVNTYNDAIKAGDPGFTNKDNYAITVNKGKLIVKGAAFGIMPTVASEIEYGDAYTIGYYTTGEIDESKLVFVIGETEYPYANKDKKEGEEGHWVLPTERGNYNVTIKEGTVVGTGTSLGAEAAPMATAFNIVPKKLTLTVKNQTVRKNDPITILDELVAGNEGADGIAIVEDLAPGDEIADLGLTYSFDDAVVTIEGGKITHDAVDNLDDAILVALGNENYALKGGVYTKGKLTVSNTFTAILKNDGTAPAVIAEAASNGSKYNVNIDGRTLKGGQWNAMVLPFAVEPLEFCKAIKQYAVFNTLQKVEKDESDVLKDKIYFKLEMNTIPANTPFLVKPVEAVEFGQINDNGTPANDTDDYYDITLRSVTFEGTGADPVYTAISGAKFTGTYKATADIESSNWWALAGGIFKHFSDPRTGGLKFTNAFIELTSGAVEARFFVEEPGDGGVTAIKSLNTDTMQSVDLDGWYTVGGMKLQGAPTQKGVYINNGKKVIIK